MGCQSHIYLFIINYKGYVDRPAMSEEALEVRLNIFLFIACQVIHVIIVQKDSLFKSQVTQIPLSMGARWVKMAIVCATLVLFLVLNPLFPLLFSLFPALCFEFPAYEASFRLYPLLLLHCNHYYYGNELMFCI